MLSQQILSTLHFFDLQDMPLTLFELHKFLLGDLEIIKASLSQEWEVNHGASFVNQQEYAIDEVLEILNTGIGGQVEEYNGYYFLRGRRVIVNCRLNNYLFGIVRERRIRRYLPFVRFLPFVRGVAISGSQASGQQKESSDIDLLIITEANFMWLARTLVSIYFQIFGVRRHGKKIQNRFCLNHYLSAPRPVDRERNLYKAMEYLRLRPVIYPQTVIAFQKNNSPWLRLFFPNAGLERGLEEVPSILQTGLEKLLDNFFGQLCERLFKLMEKSRIKQDEFTFVLEDELSFHPHSQHRALLARFFAGC